MNIVILGASGLIGHKLFLTLSQDHNVRGVIHQKKNNFSAIDFLQQDTVIEQIDVLNFESVTEILGDLRPDVILNCVGITKRKSEITQPLVSIGVNALFPHKLVELSRSVGFRVIHFSTDCVFNGELGNYTEDSVTTGSDAYGKTKALGEINYPDSLTIRSSFIGRELVGKTELLEWLLAQNGKSIKGFTHAYYSGVSTIFMSTVVKKIIEEHVDLNQLVQLATPEPISKYDLLCCARDAFGLNIDIIPDDSVSIRPTLNGGMLAEKLSLVVPDWNTMMAELAADSLYKNL